MSSRSTIKYVPRSRPCTRGRVRKCLSVSRKTKRCVRFAKCAPKRPRKTQCKSGQKKFLVRRTATGLKYQTCPKRRVVKKRVGRPKKVTHRSVATQTAPRRRARRTVAHRSVATQTAPRRRAPMTRVQDIPQMAHVTKAQIQSMIRQEGLPKGLAKLASIALPKQFKKYTEFQSARKMSRRSGAPRKRRTATGNTWMMFLDAKAQEHPHMKRGELMSAFKDEYHHLKGTARIKMAGGRRRGGVGQDTYGVDYSDNRWGAGVGGGFNDDTFSVDYPDNRWGA